MVGRYRRFRRVLPRMCARVGLDAERLVFADYAALVEVWLEENDPRSSAEPASAGTRRRS
jgi:hypothetical protein